MMYALLRGEWQGYPANIPEEELTKNQWKWVVLNKNERMSIRDVIDAYTINGAKALSQADKVGSLEVGKLADFIIINNDIITMAETVTEDANGEEFVDVAYTICDKAYDKKYCSTEVKETYINGVKVYDDNKD